MLPKSNFWIWIGREKSNGKTQFEMGETAADLYWKLHAKGYFGKADPSINYRMLKAGVTKNDIQRHIEPGETWEDAEKKVGLGPLNSHGFAEIIGNEMLPDWEQVKLLEIDQKGERIFDYSRDRLFKYDNRLEVPETTWFTASLFDGEQEKRYHTRGPMNMFAQTLEILKGLGRTGFVDVDDLCLDLRYLYPGKVKGYDMEGFLLTIMSEKLFSDKR